MCNSLEQLRVLSVSTIPSTGFMARLAIPVLKFMEVMSRIAVPVVSEPVPAVVGTGQKVSTTSQPQRAYCVPAIRGRSFSSMGNPFPTGALIKSNRSASL